MLFALLLASLPAVASFDVPRTISPAAYQSPSGAFVCEVDPSDIYGRGEAHYRLRQNGAVGWEGQKPFTLVQAGVTDDGVVAGYGYTYGENGFSEKGYQAGPGEFVVAMMDKAGALRLHEVVKREPSRFLHCLPNPLARGVMVDGPNDRFIVRVSDPDVNRARETWWTYQLHRQVSGDLHRVRDLPLQPAGGTRPVVPTCGGELQRAVVAGLWHPAWPGAVAGFGRAETGVAV